MPWSVGVGFGLSTRGSLGMPRAGCRENRGQNRQTYKMLELVDRTVPAYNVQDTLDGPDLSVPKLAASGQWDVGYFMVRRRVEGRVLAF